MPKKELYSFKDQFLIDKMITENCQSKQKNLSIASIDNKKSYLWCNPRMDSKSSKRLEDILSYNNIPKYNTERWHTNLRFIHEDCILEIII